MLCILSGVLRKRYPVLFYVTLNIFFKKLFTNSGKFKTTTFKASHFLYVFQKRLLLKRHMQRKIRSTHSSTAINNGGRKNAMRSPATNPEIMQTKRVFPSLFKNNLKPPHFPYFTLFSVLSFIVLYVRLRFGVTHCI